MEDLGWGEDGGWGLQDGKAISNMESLLGWSQACPPSKSRATQI